MGSTAVEQFVDSGNISLQTKSIAENDRSFMRILHVIASVDPRSGGPIEGVIRQAQSREESQTALTHVASLDDPGAPWVKSCPVKTFALGSPSPRMQPFRRYIPWLRYGYTPHFAPWLRRHARDYDVVVVNGLWNYSALGARRALAGSDMPYVVFTHGMLDPWFKATYPVKHLAKQVFWWFSEGPLLANARAVLFTTEEERQLARNAFWPYSITERVVGYGTADVEGDASAQVRTFRDALPSLGNRRFLLFLSRIHPKKGCDLLIDAFAHAAAKHPDIDLVMAGPDQTGWQHELQKRARALGVADRVHWPGMLGGDVKWGAYRACEAFVLPSHQENFGIVVAEAMAAGKPVLITNKVNIWREVEEWKAGLVADDNGPGVRSLLNRFLSLGADQTAAMAANARACFVSHFDMRKTSHRILDTLHEVTA